MRIFITLAVAALITAGSAGGATIKGYADGTDLGNAIEVKGFIYGGKHKAVDTGFCSGLRRYGVKRIDYFDHFYRFKCTLVGADGHYYDAQVTITKSTSSRFWWKITSIHKSF